MLVFARFFLSLSLWTCEDTSISSLFLALFLISHLCCTCTLKLLYSLFCIFRMSFSYVVMFYIYIFFFLIFVIIFYQIIKIDSVKL